MCFPRRLLSTGLRDHHLLHGALVEGRVMVVQGIGPRKARVFLCHEDVCVEGAGTASRLHTLYDWGATVTLVTHAAALKAGLERKRQTPVAIAGLGGRCTMVDSYYMVPVVDGNKVVRVVKALGVDHIAKLAASDVPEDVVTRLPRTKGSWRSSPDQQEMWRCWSAWTTRVGFPCTWRAAGLRKTTCG
jgi:hypothetical protein